MTIVLAMSLDYMTCDHVTGMCGPPSGHISAGHSSTLSQGWFPVRKRTGTLRIWERGARAYMGVQSPWSGGQGEAPLKLKAFTAEESKFVTLI